MKTFNRKTGGLAESLAAQELEKEGYQILEKNFSNRFGEIDLIARDKDILVFVEVKSKIGVDFGIPEEMIGSRKLQRIRNMATIYLGSKSVSCRIDIIVIVFGENKEVLRLTHYENVY